MTIKLRGSTDGSVSISAPADTSPSGADITLTLPTDAGSANQFIKNSGTAGTLDYSSMVEFSNGHVAIGATTDTAVFRSSAADGEAADVYVGVFENLEETAGQSYGVNIRAGSNSTDHGFRVRNRANDATQFLVRGDGNVGIGDTAPDALLSIKGDSDSNTTPSIRLKDGTDTREAWISNTAGDLVLANGGDDNVPHCVLKMFDGNLMTFSTANTERARITSAGAFKSSTDGTYQNTSSTSHEFCQSNASVYALRIEHSGTTPSGILIDYSGVTQNDTGSSFIQGEDDTTFRFRFASNGGLYNYSGNDSNLCDEREKKNIETLDSTWGCLKNWELKKFHYNEDADTDDKRYGVIAQQVEQHCPELISDWIKQSAAEAVLDDDGNVVTPAREEVLRKGVKEQQMMWMAIKALQEAQNRIETLEAKVAALEAA